MSIERYYPLTGIGASREVLDEGFTDVYATRHRRHRDRPAWTYVLAVMLETSYVFPTPQSQRAVATLGKATQEQMHRDQATISLETIMNAA